MMRVQEITIYIIIGMLVYIIISLPGIFFPLPELSEPTPINVPDISVNPPDVDPPILSPPTGLVTIFWILIILLIALILYKIIPVISNLNSSGKIKPKQLSQKESEIRLKDAREAAYLILREGLISMKYTDVYIAAYQRLDADLEHFREIHRPKYWTPKEYSYSVRPPVFRPAVFSFVEIFYDIRYGKILADKSDIENFILMLDYLFMEDVPSDVKISMENAFKEKTSELMIINIPRRGDPTKPGGNR